MTRTGERGAEAAAPAVPVYPLVLVLGLLAAFGPVSIDMYLPSLPTIARDFGVDAGRIQLTLGVFLVGFAAGQLVYGPLSDHFGRRPVLLTGIGIYICASALCALSPDADALITFRALQAVGGCAGAVIARATVRDLYATDQAARMMSFMTLVTALAPLMAPLIGGQILLYFDWRTIFWVLCGFGVICALAVLTRLPESNPPERRSNRGLGAAFLGYAHVLTDRRAVGCMLASAGAFAGMFAYLSGIPFVYIELFGVPPELFGFLFGLNIVALMIGAFINSRLVVRLGAQRMMAIGTAIAAAAGLALAFDAATGFGGLLGIVIPLVFYIGTLNLIGSNGLALAAERFGSRAGAVAALFGAVQFAIGAVAAGLLAALNDGTALPMAAIIAVAGMMSAVAQRTLGRDARPANLPSD